MQNFRNYYEILGVNRDIESDEIKRAYRRLARTYHPDMNPGNKEAEERFKDINEAYEVLSDPDRRARYDKFGNFWKQKGFSGVNKAWDFFKTKSGDQSEEQSEEDFSKIRDFNEFFDTVLNNQESSRKGGRPNRTDRPSPGGSDYSGNAVRPNSRGNSRDTYFNEPAARPNAFNEARNSEPRRAAETPRDDWGPSRNDARNESRNDDWGTSSKPRDDNWGPPSQAPNSGYDRTNDRRNTYPAEDPTPRKPQPRDAEAQLTVPLEKAYNGGKERIRLEDGRLLEVTMPGGLVSGQRIRLEGQGINGGDLFLTIDLVAHPFYRFDGINLVCQVPLTVPEAILGGEIEVPTLDGLVRMNIPSGVKSGQRYRLAKKGYPDGNGNRGDQIVELQYVLPKTLSDRETELYEELRQINTNNPRSNLTT